MRSLASASGCQGQQEGELNKEKRSANYPADRKAPKSHVHGNSEDRGLSSLQPAPAGKDAIASVHREASRWSAREQLGMSVI
jgi:hypothetical protein